MCNNLMIESVRRYGNKAALIDEKRTMTYEELEVEGQEIKKRIGTRKFVFLLADNSMETVGFYFGLVYSGSVPFMVNPGIDNEALEKLLLHYKPQFIWRKKDVSTEQMNCILDRGRYGLFEYSKGFIEIYDELALLLTTSGSTGSYKVVRISYSNIWANAMIASEVAMLNGEDRMITICPLYHSYGLGMVHAHFILGAAVVLTNDDILTEGFWRLFECCKVTNFHAVPYSYELMERMGVFDGIIYPVLRKSSVAGSGIKRALQQKILDSYRINDRSFIHIYGQTEGTMVLSADSFFKMFDKPGSIGRCVRNMSCRIVDGELVFYGPSTCLGYAEKPEDLSGGDDNHGVLYTGDLAVIDEEGYIFLKGRIKRIIKLLGARISLDEIEDLLYITYPEGSFACVGDDDCLRVFAATEDRNISRALSKRLKLPANIIHTVFIDKIPRLGNGKIDYKNLKEYKVFP